MKNKNRDAVNIPTSLSFDADKNHAGSFAFYFNKNRSSTQYFCRNCGDFIERDTVIFNKMRVCGNCSANQKISNPEVLNNPTGKRIVITPCINCGFAFGAMKKQGEICLACFDKGEEAPKILVHLLIRSTLNNFVSRHIDARGGLR